MITDGGGVPLAVTLTGGNRHDVTQLIPLIEAIPPVRGCRGRPRRRPVQVFADRACDHDKYRSLVRARRIEPVIARRGTAHDSGRGRYRWVVEQAIALLHWFRPGTVPLGDPRRHPRGLPHHRLRRHLLAPAQDLLIVLGPLKCRENAIVSRKEEGMDMSDVWVANHDGTDIVRARDISEVGVDYDGNVTARLVGREGTVVTLVAHRADHSEQQPGDLHRQLVRGVAELSDSSGAHLVRPVYAESSGWQWVREPL